jgi:uncharacterized membrane protein
METLPPLTAGLDSFSMVSAGIIGYVGVVIMMIGSIKALWLFTLYLATGKGRFSHIRIDLGKHLALGLEFFIGKDIIESVVHPTWDQLGKLGAIVLLRTVITIFLARELKEVEEEMRVEQMEKKIAS